MDTFIGHDGATFARGDTLQLRRVEVVAVSGKAANPCGHMLLFADGYYFHIAGLASRPRWFNEVMWDHYLTSHGQVELSRYGLYLPYSEGARDHLLAELRRRWLWGVLPNNCSSFVESVVNAGRNPFSLGSNCPAMLPHLFRGPDGAPMVFD